jgi:hypothetical protein
MGPRQGIEPTEDNVNANIRAQSDDKLLAPTNPVDRARPLARSLPRWIVALSMSVLIPSCVVGDEEELRADEVVSEEQEPVEETEVGTLAALANNWCSVKAATVAVTTRADGRRGVWGRGVAECDPGRSVTFTLYTQEKLAGSVGWVTREGHTATHTGTTPKTYRTYIGFFLVRGACYRSKVVAFGSSETGPISCF